MDVRTPFFQNIACVLIGVLFLNPIMSTAASWPWMPRPAATPP